MESDNLVSENPVFTVSSFNIRLFFSLFFINLLTFSLSTISNYWLKITASQQKIQVYRIFHLKIVSFLSPVFDTFLMTYALKNKNSAVFSKFEIKSIDDVTIHLSI